MEDPATPNNIAYQLIPRGDSIPETQVSNVCSEIIQQCAKALEYFPESDQAIFNRRAQEMDVKRIVYLAGKTKIALRMVIAAILLEGGSIQELEEILHWMDILPPGAGASEYNGIKIALRFIQKFLTDTQKWLLFTFAFWSPAPSSASSLHVIAAARESGKEIVDAAAAEDIVQLVVLGLLSYTIAPQSQTLPESLAIRERIAIDPYIAHELKAESNEWNTYLQESAETVFSAAETVQMQLIEWAQNFIVTAAEDIGEYVAVHTHLADNAANLLWDLLRREAPHIQLCLNYADDLSAFSEIYEINLALMAPLRKVKDPDAAALREHALLCGVKLAKREHDQQRIMIYCLQLADIRIDENQFTEAEHYTDTALTAALAIIDFPAISFITLRLAAIQLRLQKYRDARNTAIQAMLVAKSKRYLTDFEQAKTIHDQAQAELDKNTESISKD